MSIWFAWAQLILTSWLVALLDVSAQNYGSGEWTPDATTTLPPIDSFSVRVGATASFSGRHANKSREAYQGLILAQEVINSSGVFRTRSNSVITADLLVLDDESSSSKTRLLYEMMTGSNQTRFFIGPFGSTLSQQAAQAMETAFPKRVLMLHAAPDTSIYTRGHKWIFAVNPLVRDYFTTGLQILREQFGAQTVFIVYDMSREHWNMCDGARYHARLLHYEILGVVQGDITELTSLIRTARAANPDVFITCSNLTQALDMAMISRALMFNPKAMLTNHANTPEFVAALGARNANYMLGPQVWNRNQSGECRVFGSSENFVNLYRQRWGTNPTAHSAHAAMALIAIMLVTELVAQSPSKLAHILDDGPSISGELLSQLHHEFVQQLHLEKFETFAGSLRFSSRNGSRVWGAFPSTEQVVPNTSAKTPAERYMQSEFKLVTKDNPPRYPAPTWEQRELEIYPCPAGSIKVRSNGSTCELCPVGRVRDNLDVHCGICKGRFYGDRPGMLSCNPCQRGMNCSQPFPLLASPGFYRLDFADQPENGVYPHYYTCHPRELCLGANQCAGDNIGIVCANCRPGWTTKGWSALGTAHQICTECTGTGSNVLWFLGATCFYIGYISVVTVSDRASDRSLIAIHAVVLKIGINYGTFMSSVLDAVDFEVLQSNPVLRDSLLFIMNPLLSFMIFDCSSGMSVSPEFLAVLFGWIVIPIGLFFSWSFFALLASMLICFHRIATPPSHRQENVGTAPTLGKGPTLRRHASIDGEVEFAVDVFDDAFQATEEVDNPAPTAMPEHEVPWFLKPVHCHINHRMDRHLETLCVRTAVISTYILYPIALRLMITGMQCVKMDQYRMISNLDRICFQDGHTSGFTFSLIGTILYGLGVPAFTFCKLYSIRNKLLDFDVKNMYGFLFNGFEPSCYNFEVFYMIRKFLFIVASVIPDLYARTLAMLWLCLFFLAVQLLFRPWDNRSFFIFDQLETLNLLAVALTLTVRIVFEVRKSLGDSIYSTYMQSQAFTICCWICALVAHAAFWSLALGGLLRNIVIRHLQFRQRLMPDSLNCFQRFLCSLAKSKDHLVTMRPFVHSLDFEDVSHREKSLLSSVLYDTLEQYVISSKRRDKFCMEYIWGAIQEAFRLHEEVYLHKAQSLVKHHQSYEVEGGETEEKGVTIEEFQAALMSAWPGIAEGEDKFFQTIESYEYDEVLTMAARKHDLVWQKNMPLLQMVEILERRSEMSHHHDDAGHRHEEVQMMPSGGDIDVENVPVDGMEEAYFDFGSAAFTPNLDELISVQLLLDDYQAGFQEFLELESEAQRLRNLCLHRVHVNHAVAQSATPEVAEHVRRINFQADIEEVAKFDKIYDETPSEATSRFDRRSDEDCRPQLHRFSSAAELGQEETPHQTDSTGERQAHDVQASSPGQEQEDAPGMSKPEQQTVVCLPNSAVQRRELDADTNTFDQQRVDMSGQQPHLLGPAFKPKAAHPLSRAFIESGSGAGGVAKTLVARSSTDV